MLSMEITELGQITYSKSTWRAHTSAKACINKWMGKSRLYILYRDGDPNHSKNLTGSELDTSSDFLFWKIQLVVLT